jgi:tetratricopeptide (TPR) repeat protein
LVAYVYQGDDLNFQNYSRSAYELVRNDGDLDRAKPFLDKALELLTPEEFEGDPDTAIALMWLPAFGALLGANPDPELALSEADRSLEMLRSFEGERFVNDSPMGALYLTLGKIELAREWFEESTEPGQRRQIFLAAIAYVEEDHKAMTEHLEQALKAAESLRRARGSVRNPDRERTPVLAPTAVLLLTRGGLQLPKADNFNPGIDPGLPDSILERIERRRSIRRGMLAVSQDNRIEGMRMLGDALLSISLTDSNAATAYLMGSEILAEAWREQGDSTNAVAVLRTALEKESFLLLDQSVLTGPLWLRLQAQLAQLYRDMGQHEDASKIEAELRRLLALADPDHPILRQLDRTKELALREAADN